MSEPAKQQSNPSSTGVSVLISRRVFKQLSLFSCYLAELHLAYHLFQSQKSNYKGIAGFNTDDFIVFSEQPQIQRKAKLLAQIKHEIGITASNNIFAEVIHNAWVDFNDAEFDGSNDAIALITGPLSATDVSGVRPIWVLPQVSCFGVEI